MHVMVAFLLWTGAGRESLFVGTTAGRCAMGQRGEGQGRSRARGDGDELLPQRADEGQSSTRAELVGVDGFIFFSMWCRWGARRPDALLALVVRALAVPNG